MDRNLAILNTNQTALIVCICLLINVAFKLINLTAEPLWYDECFSVFYSQQSISNIINVSTWEPPPPLFNLILHFWIKLFGISELSVRILPLLMSSLAGAVLYLFLKKHATVRIALTATVLYLFSDISFYYAQEVRCYSFALFVSIISIWIFIEMLAKPGYVLSVGLGISYYILIMTHYLTCFVLLFQGVLFIFYTDKKLFKHYLICLATFIVLLAHWIPRIIEVATGKGGNNHWLTSPTPNQLVDFLLEVNNGLLQTMLLSILACMGIGSALINRRKLFINKEKQAIFIYSLGISIGTILLSYFISSFKPMFLDRYLLYSLIGFILFFSICISYLPVRDSYYYMLLLLIGCFACSQVNIHAPLRKMDYRNAAVYVKQHEENNSAIFIQTSDLVPLFTYYYERAMFEDFSNLEHNSTVKRIFSGYDSTKLSGAITIPYPKIIHLETFSSFTDPNQTVKAWFLKHGYRKTNEDDTFILVKISIYQK